MVDLSISLPDGFLKEETRDGYTIPAEMKKVWAVELDLYLEFDRICKKHSGEDSGAEHSSTLVWGCHNPGSFWMLC